MPISKSAAEAAVVGIKSNVSAAMQNYLAGHSDGKHRSQVQAMARKSGAARVTFFQKEVQREVKIGEKEVQVEQKGWHGTSTMVVKKVPITESRVFYEDMSETQEKQLVQLALASASPEYYKHMTHPDSRFHYVCPIPSGWVGGEVTLGIGSKKSISAVDRVSIIIDAGKGSNHHVVTVTAEPSSLVANWQALS